MNDTKWTLIRLMRMAVGCEPYEPMTLSEREMDARRGIKERKLWAVSRKPPKGILANRNQWHIETDKALGILIPGMSVD